MRWFNSVNYVLLGVHGSSNNLVNTRLKRLALFQMATAGIVINAHLLNRCVKNEQKWPKWAWIICVLHVSRGVGEEITPKNLKQPSRPVSQQNQSTSLKSKQFFTKLLYRGGYLCCQGHGCPDSLQALAELGTKAALNPDWEVAFWLFGALMCWTEENDQEIAATGFAVEGRCRSIYFRWRLFGAVSWCGAPWSQGAC